MQQIMTRWIEAADARAVCEEAMAAQMLANPAAPAAPRSLVAMLRLPALFNRPAGALAWAMSPRPSADDA